MKKWKRGNRAVHYIEIGGKLQRRWGTVMETSIDGIISFLPDNNAWEKPYRVATASLRRLIRKTK